MTLVIVSEADMLRITETDWVRSQAGRVGFARQNGPGWLVTEPGVPGGRQRAGWLFPDGEAFAGHYATDMNRVVIARIRPQNPACNGWHIILNDRGPTQVVDLPAAVRVIYHRLAELSYEDIAI